jgi:hypothetical protein
MWTEVHILCNEFVTSALPTVLCDIFQSTVEELIAATAYFDLFLRSVTEPGLLYSFVRFVLKDEYDGERILDTLIQRINSKSRVSG